jgi:14-3-3 protein epsilon
MNMINKSRDEYIYLAKLYEKAEKFEDMIFFINKFIEIDPKLSLSEKDLLSNSYRIVIKSKRSSHRILNEIEKLELKKNSNNVKLISDIKYRVESEIKSICENIQSLIDKYLLPSVNDYESKVFFLKLKGDYYRYRSEVSINEEYSRCIFLADKSYNEALEISERHLPLSDQNRLGLILNFSIFYYECKKSKDDAVKLSQPIYNELKKIKQDLEKKQMRNSLLILELIKENLILWTNEIAD